MDNFSPAQYERFEAYRRHALPKQAVRKVPILSATPVCDADRSIRSSSNRWVSRYPSLLHK